MPHALFGPCPIPNSPVCDSSYTTGRDTNPELKNVAVNCQAVPLSKLDKMPKIFPTSLI